MNLIRKHILHLFGQRYDTKKTLFILQLEQEEKNKKLINKI
jgi:hypothetical protein